MKALLTDPNVDDGPVPTNEYRLRGVSIATTNQSSTTYMIYPPSLSADTGVPSPDLSWWRISYDTAGDRALVSKEVIHSTGRARLYITDNIISAGLRKDSPRRSRRTSLRNTSHICIETNTRTNQRSAFTTAATGSNPRKPVNSTLLTVAGALGICRR